MRLLEVRIERALVVELLEATIARERPHRFVRLEVAPEVALGGEHLGADFARVRLEIARGVRFGVRVQFLLVGELFATLVAVERDSGGVVVEVVLIEFEVAEGAFADLTLGGDGVVGFVVRARHEVVIFGQGWSALVALLGVAAEVSFVVISELGHFVETGEAKRAAQLAADFAVFRVFLGLLEGFHVFQEVGRVVGHVFRFVLEQRLFVGERFRTVVAREVQHVRVQRDVVNAHMHLQGTLVVEASITHVALELVPTGTIVFIVGVGAWDDAMLLASWEVDSEHVVLMTGLVTEHLVAHCARNHVVLLKLFMILKLTLLIERFVATIALVRICSDVHRLFVSANRAFVIEPLVTVRTFVGFLPSVESHMNR